jgi:hypothetical protein
LTSTRPAVLSCSSGGVRLALAYVS